MDNEQLKALVEWSIKIQASIDTIKYFLVGFGLLGGAVVSLSLVIVRAFKGYTVERLKAVDDKCAECAKRNTDEHKALHGRIDEHIRDHANKNK